MSKVNTSRNFFSNQVHFSNRLNKFIDVKILQYCSNFMLPLAWPTNIILEVSTLNNVSHTMKQYHSQTWLQRHQKCLMSCPKELHKGKSNMQVTNGCHSRPQGTNASKLIHITLSKYPQQPTMLFLLFTFVIMSQLPQSYIVQTTLLNKIIL